MLKAIHAQEDAQAAKIKAASVADKLETMKLYKAAEKVLEGIDETLIYHDFPREHHRHRVHFPLQFRDHSVFDRRPIQSCSF